MHKHTTASGKIVIHVHPYDLTNDGSDSQHHKTESEIHFLDVVFQGQFLQTCFLAMQVPNVAPAVAIYGVYRESRNLQACHAFTEPRGPPAIFS